MQIDENTKVIGRFHKEASPRGLNIYNPYFRESNINALYILFHNQDPRVLITGLRSLNLAGAITAGFESDQVLPTLIDELDDVAKFIGRIGFITNNNGIVSGHAQGGLGMLNTIKQVSELNGKRLVIVGAGNVAKGLLFEMDKVGIKASVSLFNRTVDRALALKDRFSFIESVKPLSEISSAEGDIFVNLTHIGGKVKDYSFPKEVINAFSSIVDVTFETESTNLVTTAISLNKKVATGWDMFTNQGIVCLDGLLGIKADPILFKKHVAAGLSSVVV